jgi:hypothetical protein
MPNLVEAWTWLELEAQNKFGGTFKGAHNYSQLALDTEHPDLHILLVADFLPWQDALMSNLQSRRYHHLQSLSNQNVAKVC